MKGNVSYLQFAVKGIWPLKRYPTFNPRIWFYYLMWTIYSYLWIERWWMEDRRGWRQELLGFIRRRYPGHMSLRSDFTDERVGALYTGKMDGWSQKAFDQLLENIEKEMGEGDPNTN